MKVFYRLTEIPSTNPSPIFQEDKLALNELCLKSFVSAYNDLQPHVTFICDHCTEKTKEMIERVCPFEKTIMMTNIGINETAMLQYTMANELEGDESILFQECDYIHQPNIGKRMDSAIQQLQLVSPYDHANFYIDHEMHSEMVLLKLIEDTHWRSTERNTLTFGVRLDVFKKNLDIFKKWGYLDDGNWKELRERGHLLFVPIPSFSTHMAKYWLAPSVNWEELWRTQI